MKRSESIQFKLIRVYSVLLLIVILVMGFISIMGARSIIVGNTMGEVRVMIDELGESQEEMDNSKNEIVYSLDELSSIAVQNSAATEEVSASMQEQYAANEEILAMSESLSSLATDLHGVVQSVAT